MTNNLKSQQGFTLIELLIYTALTAIIVGMFGAILITVTRVQGDQSGSTKVTRELNFLVGALRQRINDAEIINSGGVDSLIYEPASFPGTSTTIALDGSVITVAENGESAAPLSTDQIRVDYLEFDLLTDEDSTVVQITLTVSNNTNNPDEAASKTIQTSVAPFLLAQ
ncbi:MAG: hypothetical protein COU11_03125 [Candidatus Harrisonbacteria bacterium CG10_big_fil_rev_8_21_14_0_10_49_15]|uniref:Type II secretion system protein n=1 Tax=Candidatus Harrisonbacteria bacterium CG10_big_fil_rev_8_21_14_0_10_49_15 TaxID=1974587 RepID=A0A2H0UKP7_9BACT|nr:MAG: hypothetical protein COU11_03125 [Candidatus Harrisonbacteria bacterium CG10_big_fil_rev_8_21_14_0_10_49_15]